MLFPLILIVFFHLNKKCINEVMFNIKTHELNQSKIEYYDLLFNSIQYDYFNLSTIYNKNTNNLYNYIKIKHKSNNEKFNSTICVFGVLCNDRGLKIEKSMLNWLLPEYDVYCVYQKFPGIFFEYAALRFAQWFSEKYNITIILYVHTKGAFNPQNIQEDIRELWKYEFTKERKQIYIKLLNENITDISLPFTNGRYTWYNGMFISDRAFKLNLI